MFKISSVQKWKRHTHAGNEAFKNKFYLSAMIYYQQAIALVEDVMSDEKDAQLQIACLYVSYQNLAELYAQNKEHDLAHNILSTLCDSIMSELRKVSVTPNKRRLLTWALKQASASLCTLKKELNTDLSTLSNMCERHLLSNTIGV
ncbi:DUF2753 family protein [Agaribacter marinus]|uniref:Uncharacterized protein n=1 Tax=Agaribacter marinus TaxID=1431249 RepID=A0AA37SV92_9ALTE|nr:DUF2753 family protein [Agaribacter marinus]GLR69927.1 hypothetical protein GCM10007852_08350 [Agaribacter marinus]